MTVKIYNNQNAEAAANAHVNLYLNSDTYRSMVDDINALFGTADIDGFTVLAAHDANADGVGALL